MAEAKLKVQKGIKAQAIVQTKEGSFTLDDCVVFANTPDSKDIIFLLSDNTAGVQIQVTMQKTVILEDEKED